ncbi:MAG: T4 prohead core scaffold protein, partial [Candidatus Nanopelagicaceae bacterium]
LQEMEVGTKQSKTAVNAGAKAADPMQKLAPGAVAGQTGSWEDLGGPTPENYKSDDDSAKLSEPSLKTVKDIVSKGAKAAEAMHKMKEDEDLEDEEVIAEEESEEETAEVVAEEETEEETEEEDTEEVEEEFSVDEDVEALLSGEELSEEFQEKAKLIFETALRARVSEIRESLEAQYEERLVEQVEEIKSTLQERVDAYLEYVSAEWITENQLTVQQGIKEELTESFMSGLKGLFEEHYVTIPEDKYDVLNSMVEKLDEMETKLNEQIEKNISLNKRLAESVADGIFDEVSEGLAVTQKEKLASLAESVEFESETKYREKLETLRESYFPTNVVSNQARTETLSEGVDVAPEFYSNSMNAYLKALSVTSPKN